MTGMVFMSIFMTIGSDTSSGRNDDTIAIYSRMFRAAMYMSVP